MAQEAEAAFNPDAQRGAQSGAQPGEGASAQSAAGTSAPSAADSQSDANREQGTGDRERRRSTDPESQTQNPVSSANPETTNPAKKPKRKYTMSQRALDSRRINIKKALAVLKEVLFRSTPRRKESCRTKLVAAREAKRRKHEEGKSTGISHGLTCADLRGSLTAAGATPEELKAHRQNFRDGIGPQTPNETKLVRGMADCAWRREQTDHVQAVEEIITMQARLIVAAEPSQVGLTDFAVAKLALNLFNKGLDLGERHKKLNGRFAHLAYLFLAGREQAEGFGKELGVKLRWNSSNVSMIAWSAEAMGNPFVTPGKVAQVMAPKTGEMKPASEFGWKGKEKREAERQERIKEQALHTAAPELVNFPYEHPAMSVADLLKGGQNVVLVMDGGKTQVPLGETVEGQPVRTEYVAAGTAAVVAGIGVEEWPEWREAEVAAALRKKYLETSVALRGQNQVGGVTKEDLVKSWLEAFGRNGVRDSRLGEETGFGVRDSGFAEEDGPQPASPRIPNPETQTPSPASSANPGAQTPSPAASANPEPRIPNPDPKDAERITAVAEAAWERVQVCEERSQQERKKVGEILAQVGSSVREKLDQIMGLFTGAWEMFIDLYERAAKLKKRVCEMLEARHPRTPEKPRGPNDFEGLRPSWLWSNPKMKKRFLEDMNIVEGPEPVATGRRKKKQSTDGADSAG